MKKWIIGGIVIFLLFSCWYLWERNYEMKQVNALKREQQQRTELINTINKKYHKNVKVMKDTNLYSLTNSKYHKNGKVMKDVSLTLEDRETGMLDEKYFKIEGIDEYIYYEDVEPIDTREINDIYKNYIPYNLDIVTENANFYDHDKKAFHMNDQLRFTVLGKTSDRYYVEYNQSLLSVLKKDVVKEIPTHHTDEVNAPSVAVLNYHFFYDEEKGESCNQIICHEKKTFIEQLNYLKEENFFTADMESFSMYLDGTIQLPYHTVLITIDDGAESVKEIANPLLDEYKMRATVFLITAWYNPAEYRTQYVEVHSHTHEMHEAGVCPGAPGKGGGITCLDSEIIKNDLQQSRQVLDGSTAIAYPFYDYNDYAIEQLKNNGFTIAFAGNFEKAKPGINKYIVPRYSVSTDWTMEVFKSVVN